MDRCNHDGRRALRHAASALPGRAGDCAGMMAELDRLLNDPAVPMDPARVWSLVVALAGCEDAAATERARA